MTLYDQLNNAMQARDISAYLNLLHDDFVAVFHKTGSSFNKTEWEEMVTGMFANEHFVQDSSRCIYENNDISVQHAFMSYPDGSKEAVMLVLMLKDGKAIRMETGATTLD